MSFWGMCAIAPFEITGLLPCTRASWVGTGRKCNSTPLKLDVMRKVIRSVWKAWLKGKPSVLGTDAVEQVPHCPACSQRRWNCAQARWREVILNHLWRYLLLPILQLDSLWRCGPFLCLATSLLLPAPSEYTGQFQLHSIADRSLKKWITYGCNWNRRRGNSLVWV